MHVPVGPEGIHTVLCNDSKAYSASAPPPLPLPPLTGATTYSFNGTGSAGTSTYGLTLVLSTGSTGNLFTSVSGNITVTTQGTVVVRSVNSLIPGGSLHA